MGHPAVQVPPVETQETRVRSPATIALVIFIVLRQLLIPALVLGMVLPVRIVRIVNLGTNLVVGANGKLHGVTGSQHAKEDYEPPEMVFTDEMS
jgi:hypothetical protein